MYLQAIAVASCLEEEWPVLIVVPSSLRLQWALVRILLPQSSFGKVLARYFRLWLVVYGSRNLVAA